MKKRMIPLFLCAALLLSGCGLLQREYTRTSPHSATYYEGSRRDVLRAESYQDLERPAAAHQRPRRERHGVAL